MIFDKRMTSDDSHGMHQIAAMEALPCPSVRPAFGAIRNAQSSNPPFDKPIPAIQVCDAINKCQTTCIRKPSCKDENLLKITTGIHLHE